MDDEAGDGDAGGRRPSRGVARRARAQGEQGALGPLRRARKELEWITRRRSAQIANYRRDRKIEIEEQREAMAQAKVASAGAAAKDGADVSTTNNRVGVIEDAAAIIERSRAIARLPARVSVPRSAAGGARRTTRGGRKKKTSRGSPRLRARIAAREPTRAAAARTTDTREVRQPAKRLGAGGVRADGSRRHEGAEGCGEAQRGGVRGAPYDAREEEAAGEGERRTSPSFSSDETAFAVERTRVRE